MNDVVYVLGPGSKWDDNEIQYSIRSVVKHLKNYGDIWIVGTMPRCKLSAPVRFVPVEHNRYRRGHHNVRESLKVIAKISECSEAFVLMNDDFFLTKEMDAWKIPDYYSNTLAGRTSHFNDKNVGYWRTMVYTHAVLSTLGYATRDFELHGPMIMEKAKLLKALDLVGTEPVIQLRTVYANVFPKPTCERLGDCKFGCNPDPKLTIEKMREVIATRPFFSIGDELNADQKKIFEELYPSTGKEYPLMPHLPTCEAQMEAFFPGI